MMGSETAALETVLAAGYAVFLVIVAAGLELLARFTQRRGRDTTAGGDYPLRLDRWPGSEIGHFQRGLSLTLLLLAGFILAVEAFRHHGSSDLAVLSAGLLPVLVAGRRVLNNFRGRRNAMPEWPSRLTESTDIELRSAGSRARTRRG